MTNTIMQADIQRLEALYLPKWPAMAVWGAPVTVDQAKDIILRTDSFLTSIGPYSGGNNKLWGAWARTTLGFQHLAVDEAPGNWHRQGAVQQKLRAALGFVETEYVHNTWAASSYVYGPYGWCHPSGTIWYEDNIGKYPSAREVFEEWQALAKAFPYLDLTVTLFSGESADDESNPVVSFRVQEGHVAILDFPIVPSQRSVPVRDTHALLRELVTNRSREQGLADQWIVDYSEVIRPLVAQFESEVAQELAHLSPS